MATDVGSYPPGANGLYDMAGNVWEWTADWYGADYYAHSPLSNPKGPEQGTHRTLRGGAYDTDQRAVGCGARYGDFPGYRSYNVGFRVVASPSTSGR